MTIVALVPAAGSGSRMGVDQPKQFMLLNGKTVLHRTLQKLRSVNGVANVVVVVPSSDVSQCASEYSDFHFTAGGDTRAASVANGLEYCRTRLNHAGLILVHDAARPCVRVEDINRLVLEVGECEHGGILAIPVHDTLKRGDTENRIEATVDREDMWRAVTPQLFLAPILAKALRSAEQKNLPITDEASAMELAGYKPRLVAGSQDNIKITVADDLSLAGSILAAQDKT